VCIYNIYYIFIHINRDHTHNDYIYIYTDIPIIIHIYIVVYVYNNTYCTYCTHDRKPAVASALSTPHITCIYNIHL